MERLAKQDKNIRVLKIDIGDSWNTPVSNQYNVRQLPWIWLYEGKTKRGEYKGAEIRELYELLQD